MRRVISIGQVLEQKKYGMQRIGECVGEGCRSSELACAQEEPTTEVCRVFHLDTTLTIVVISCAIDGTGRVLVGSVLQLRASAQHSSNLGARDVDDFKWLQKI